MADRNDYYAPFMRTAVLLSRQIEYLAKAGMPGGDRLPAGEILLVEQAELPSDGRVLLYGSVRGAVAVALAGQVPAGRLEVADPHLVSLKMTLATLKAHSVENVRLRLDGGLSGVETVMADEGLAEMAAGPLDRRFDAALIVLPKGRALLRRWLLEAREWVLPGGSIYLAGANDDGIHAAVKDAEGIFGPGGVLAFKKGSRVVKLMSAGRGQALPEWAIEEGVAAGTWQRFDLLLVGKQYSVRSLPGVFSAGELDPGTALLLDTVQFTPGLRLLDAGCGYGAIGMAALAGGADVEMRDAWLPAVLSSQATLRANGLTGWQVLARDMLEGTSGESYDHIVSNPPFHGGREVSYSPAEALIRGANAALKAGGRLTLVANRFIRYDRLMKDVFGEVNVLAENNKFHVLEARKAQGAGRRGKKI